MRPSMPSRKAANSTIATAISKRCSKASRMPDRPAQIARTVIRLGIRHAQRDLADARPAPAVRFEAVEEPGHRAARGLKRSGPAASPRLPPNSAITVSPPTASGRRRRAASPAGGRKTSTREPKRIRPKRSPTPMRVVRLRPSRRCAAPPARPSARRRRCRCGLSMTRPLRSLSVLALSSSALRNLPGRCSTAVIRPRTGARFTWQEKTFMNTEMRVSSVAAEAELARRQRRPDRRDDAVGGADHRTVVDRRHPFRIAEEIGAPGRQDQADPEQQLEDTGRGAGSTAAKPAMNGQPSRWIGTNVLRTVSTMLIA